MYEFYAVVDGVTISMNFRLLKMFVLGDLTETFYELIDALA